MSKTDQIQPQESLSHQIQQKLGELAELLVKQEFGDNGPAKETTFREIESAGYQVAQLAAQKFESVATEQHQEHFEGAQPCPQCEQMCSPQDKAMRRLVTRLGPVDLSEIRFYCNACRRSFFPSTLRPGA